MKKTNVIVVEDNAVMKKLYETSMKEYCCKKEGISKEDLESNLKDDLINLTFRDNIKETVYSFDLKTNDILVINLNSKDIDNKIELIRKIKEKEEEENKERSEKENKERNEGNRNNKNNKQIKIIIVFDNDNSLRKNKLIMLNLLSLNLDYYLTKDIELDNLDRICEIIFKLGNDINNRNNSNRNNSKSNNEDNNISSSNESYIEGGFKELINNLIEKEIKDILKKEEKKKEKEEELRQLNKKTKLKRVK